LFVIIKLEFPPNFIQNAPSSSRNDVVQTKEHEMNNEYQVNDPIDPDGSQWPSTFSIETFLRACGFDKP
jgi:hypothetical protein